MKIEVEPLAEGDFIENLNFTVFSKADTIVVSEPITKAEKPEIESADDSTTLTTQNAESAYYQIQIGSYSTLWRAENVARRASEHLDDSFGIILNETNGLYAVRGSPYDSRDKAINTIISYYKRSYTDIALVILSNKDLDKPGPSDERRFVQIGAFRSKYRANRFAALSRIKLDHDTRMVYDDEISLYTVSIANLDDADRQQLKQILSEVRSLEVKSHPFYEDAFIKSKDNQQNFVPHTESRPMDFYYQVQIEGAPEASKQALMSDLLDSDLDSEFKQPRKGLFIFDKLSSWRETQNFRTTRTRLTSIGRPSVVLIEK
jgi:hypothetical protein